MDGIVSSRVHVSYDVDTGDSGKTALPIHISVLAVYEKDINPEIKINDINRFIVNSFAAALFVFTFGIIILLKMSVSCYLF